MRKLVVTPFYDFPVQRQDHGMCLTSVNRVSSLLNIVVSSRYNGIVAIAVLLCLDQVGAAALRVS